jgi:hypothetical protein
VAKLTKAEILEIKREEAEMAWRIRRGLEREEREA